MRRVAEVIDCWFDSGAMPFAQWGYPHQPGSAERFAGQFPADFISEAIDQTRGWFYSLLAISTLLFSEEENRRNRRAARPAPPYPHPFRNCIVLGLMLGEDGSKMSKSKRNYREPNEIFDRYGADALRWYFFANQPPWTSIRYSEQAIKDTHSRVPAAAVERLQFLRDLRQHRRFRPGGGDCAARPGSLTPDDAGHGRAAIGPSAERGELDRWILSELSRTAAAVVERMDAYDNYDACARLTEFVDALSNWYVRRSRDRFWSGEAVGRQDRRLLDALRVPADDLQADRPVRAVSGRGDVAEPGRGGLQATSGRPSSRWKASTSATIPPATRRRSIAMLSERMAVVREIVSLGRSARMGAKLKVRQPLARVEVVLADPQHQAWLEEHAALICDELNVKRVEFTQQADQYITYTVLPDLKRLGPRLGKRLPALRKLLAEADAAPAAGRVGAAGQVTLRLARRPGHARRRRLAGPLAGQAGLGRRPGHAGAWSCFPPS